MLGRRLGGTSTAIALAISLVATAAVPLVYMTGLQSGGPRPLVVVPTGFVVETVATGFSLPSALAFGTGGGFGADLYVGDWNDAAVYRMDVATGTRTSLSTGLPNPGVIAFGPGGAFSTDLYVITSDGAITVVNSTGAKHQFTTVATPFGRDMAFDRTGGFGGDLYVMDTAGALPPEGDKVLRVEPDGNSSIFTMTPRIPQENAWGLGFGAGAFGTDLFVSFGRSTLIGTSRPSVFRIDPTGAGTLLAETPDFEELTDFAFSPGGPFGDFLYVADVYHEVLFRVSPAGVVSTFATGFQFSSHVSSDMVFGPDGALYIAEDGTHSIIRIRPESTPENPGQMDCDPDTINVDAEGQWITCYLEPPGDRNASEIDAVSVHLDSWLGPVLDEKYGFVFDPDGYLVDHDHDGILERLLKFDRQLLAEKLPPGDHVFVLTGEFSDGATFSVESETIRVIP